MPDSTRRILYVVSHVSPRVTNFARGLAERGMHVTVMDTSECWLPADRVGKGAFSGTIGPSERVAYIRVTPPVRSRSQIPRLGASMPHIMRRAYRLAVDHDTVMAYNPTAYSGVPALMAARRAGRPFVLDYADLVALYDTRAPLRTGLETALIRRADRIICLSNAWRDHLIRRFKRRPQDLAVISNGIDPRQFDFENIDASAWRPQFGVAQDERLVVYCGSSWHRRLRGRGKTDIQGFDDLLAAFGTVREKIEIARLLVLGADPRSLESRPAGVVAGGVYRTGDERHLAAMKMADCLVLPAANCATYRYFDRFKAYEYLSSGRPIVVADLPVMREIFRERAHYYAPDDVEDLARAILDMLGTDPASRPVLPFPSEFTWETLSDRLASLIHSTPARISDPK